MGLGEEHLGLIVISSVVLAFFHGMYCIFFPQRLFVLLSLGFNQINVFGIYLLSSLGGLGFSGTLLVGMKLKINLAILIGIIYFIVAFTLEFFTYIFLVLPDFRPSTALAYGSYFVAQLGLIILGILSLQILVTESKRVQSLVTPPDSEGEAVFIVPYGAGRLAWVPQQELSADGLESSMETNGFQRQGKKHSVGYHSLAWNTRVSHLPERSVQPEALEIRDT